MKGTTGRRLVKATALVCAGMVLATVGLRVLQETGRGYRVRAALGLVSHQPEPPEAAWLAQRFGPGRHSEYYEEWIVRDFFGARRGGLFVDVGAADARVNSNTWYLEQELGWSGIAVDAQEHYAAGYLASRPRTRFFTFFVSDRSDETAPLYLTDHDATASSDAAFARRFGSRGVREVPTVTLDHLLASQGIERFDFLSMDIELSEPQALAGFSIGRFRPALVCIEAHPEVLQPILEYFASNGYVVAGRYLRLDTRNLWFVPSGTPLERFPVSQAH